MSFKSQIKDSMYELLKEPSKEEFRKFLLDNTGEKDNIDFKSSWIDKGQLSKIMLSMANTGGGLIVFGVEENNDGIFEPIGINEFLDNAKIDDMIRKYVPSSVEYERLDFNFDSSEYEKLKGRKFQVLHIHNTPDKLPFISLSETENISADTIYVRRGTKCQKANAVEIERILNLRIETQFSSSSTLDLKEHLKQLKILYEEIEKEIEEFDEGSPMSIALGNARAFVSKYYKQVENPRYPKEDYEDFILRLISNKKLKVEKVLDLK